MISRSSSANAPALLPDPSASRCRQPRVFFWLGAFELALGEAVFRVGDSSDEIRLRDRAEVRHGRTPYPPGSGVAPAREISSEASVGVPPVKFSLNRASWPHAAPSATRASTPARRTSATMRGQPWRDHLACQAAGAINPIAPGRRASVRGKAKPASSNSSTARGTPFGIAQERIG